MEPHLFFVTWSVLQGGEDKDKDKYLHRELMERFATAKVNGKENETEKEKELWYR